MLRRLYHDQPESFAFTPDNLAWAKAQITKYPEGRQASAVIPLLWRAQEQEGWLSRPAMEEVARMLDMAYIRVLEVATFYFMFQLQPVGSVANIQICGTTPCMLCGSEDLVAVCREEIAKDPHVLSADGQFSWEEVECLGACSNAPMAQIGKDYYEDLTAEAFRTILRALAEGKVPTPGSQTGRFASEPASGLTSLSGVSGGNAMNASVELATRLNDTLKRIDGTEEPLITPWLGAGTTGHDMMEASDARRAHGSAEGAPEAEASRQSVLATPGKPGSSDSDEAEIKDAAAQDAAASPAETEARVAEVAEADALSDEATMLEDAETRRPQTLQAPEDGKADDLKKIKGIGPKLEKMLHEMGIFHFGQIAAWSAAEIAWVDRNLVGFKGRVTRDRWVAQARILDEGGQTEFSKRAKY